MTRVLSASLVALALGVSACASTREPQGSYSARTEKLAAECQERGGILAPTGAQTGRPETDNTCNITGGAARQTRDRQHLQHHRRRLASDARRLIPTPRWRETAKPLRSRDADA